MRHRGWLAAAPAILVALACIRVDALPAVDGELLPGQRVRLEGEAGTAALLAFRQPLLPGSTYEIRVSYPGPAAVLPTIALHSLGGGDPGPGPLRRLLDAEKIVFATDGGGAVVHGGKSFAGEEVVAVRVSWRQQAPPARGLGPEPFPFDVVLEEAPHGVPRSTLGVIAWCAAWLAGLGAAAVWASAMRSPRLRRP